MKTTFARVVFVLTAIVLSIALPGYQSNAGHTAAASAADGIDKNNRSVVTGELQVIAECEKADSRLLYFLDNDTEHLKVEFTSRPKRELRTGMKVTMRGVRTGDKFAADESSVQIESSSTQNSFAGTSTQENSILAGTFGEHKVAVILVNFQDLPTQPYTPAQAQDATFNTTSNFFRENSYGQTWLTGDVFGWYTIPVSSTSCDTAAIATYAQQAATKAGANLAAYNHYVYAFPANSCSFSGRGSIGGNPSQAWINGWFELGVVGHELGHNFGLNHSRSMDCGAVAIGSSCTVDEYGDTFDLMGASSTAHFNSYQKERLGWLNSGVSPPIQTVNASGTYFIDAYEPNGSSPKALKVLKSYDPTTGTRVWYYIELRTTTGFDATMSPEPSLLNGVVLRTGSDTNPQDTYLLDTTPSTASWYDPTLMSGQSFSDPAAGLTFTTMSAGPGGAWVQVSVGATACTHASPTLTVSPAQNVWLNSGTPNTYTLTVTNRDSGGCGASDFSAVATVPNGWSAASSVLNLPPGTTGSTAVIVTSPTGVPDGNYGIGLSAANVSDATLFASASATYTIASKLSVVDAPGAAKYTRTQKATVTATVSVLGSPVANATVSFSLTKPDGSTVTSKVITAANGVASFVYTFNKRTDPIGTYRVSSGSNANGLTGTGSTSFVVTK